MRNRILLAAAAVAIVAGVAWQAGAQQPPPQAAPAQRAVAQPRPLIFVALYERGPAWDDAKGAFQQTGIVEHMQFLRASAEKLMGAAPFQQGIAPGGADRTVGMVVVMAATQEEAESLIAADPAVANKLMKATVRRWLADRVRGY